MSRTADKLILQGYVAVFGVMSMLASSNEINVGITKNGSPIFDVLHYGAIGDGKHVDAHAFLKAWRDLCDAKGHVPTLVAPRQKTFLLTPISFRGPCKSNSIHIQICLYDRYRGKLWHHIEGWGGPCQETGWLSFEYVDSLIIAGHGELHGRDSVWWKTFPTAQAIHKDNGRTCSRPPVLSFHECCGLQLSYLRLKDSLGRHVTILGCNNSNISNIHITAPKDSPNTDGIDVSYTSHLHILDSIIETGDDCIAILSYTSWVYIEGITCGPGHGVSVGSLGWHRTEAKVEEIHVENCTFNGTQNGARFKTWQGGSGYARKITFDHISLINVNNPILIGQDYCNGRHCKDEPSAVAVRYVTYSRFRGTSASEVAISLNCSTAIPCIKILLENINITSSNPTQRIHSFCENIHGRQISGSPPVPCV